MSNIPIIISMLFVVTAFLTVWMFYKASGNSKPLLMGILAWMLFQATISLTGFYQISNSIPPRFLLLIGPGIIISILLFVTKWGKEFIDNLDLKALTIMHSVRIPVEITLYFVYSAGLIPVLMTFEGNNFDIISGITAPLIFYFVFIVKKLNRTALLIWNILCSGLLLNVVVIALLSAQTPFQKLVPFVPGIGPVRQQFVIFICLFHQDYKLVVI